MIALGVSYVKSQKRHHANAYSIAKSKTITSSGFSMKLTHEVLLDSGNDGVGGVRQWYYIRSIVPIGIRTTHK